MSEVGVHDIKFPKKSIKNYAKKICKTCTVSFSCLYLIKAILSHANMA